MRKRLLWMVVFLALLSLMVGCGSEDAAFRRVTREYPLIAWTGDRVFVYGGSPEVRLGDTEWPPPFGDAALWDPETQSYESVAQPPFDLALNDGAAAVVVGDRIVVMGTLCASRQFVEDSVSTHCEPGTLVSATYSVAEDSWETHSLPEGLAAFGHAHVEGLGATSDGRAVFWVSYRGERLWALGSDGGWEALAPLPGILRTFNSPRCMAGDTVVGLSRVRDQTSVRLHLLAFGRSDPEWTRSTPVPPPDDDEYRFTSQLVCGDDFVMVNGQFLDLVEGTWTAVPRAPVDLGAALPLWTGTEVLFLAEACPPTASADCWEGTRIDAPAAGLALDPDAGVWRTVSASPVPALDAIAAGTADHPAVAAWGGSVGEAGAPTEPFYTEIRR